MHRRGIGYAAHSPRAPPRVRRARRSAVLPRIPTCMRHEAADGRVVAHLHQGSRPHHAMKRGTHRMKLTKDSLIRGVRRRAVAVLGAAALLTGFGMSAASVAHAAGTGQITG